MVGTARDSALREEEEEVVVVVEEDMLSSPGGDASPGLQEEVVLVSMGSTVGYGHYFDCHAGYTKIRDSADSADSARDSEEEEEPEAGEKVAAAEDYTHGVFEVGWKDENVVLDPTVDFEASSLALNWVANCYGDEEQRTTRVRWVAFVALRRTQVSRTITLRGAMVGTVDLVGHLKFSENQEEFVCHCSVGSSFALELRVQTSLLGL
jgi:hypothetical protein